MSRLIILEGADGTGKSTQFQLLCERLKSTGESVVTYDFPHKAGSPIADLIAAFLTGRFGDVTPEFLALAFSLDRLNSRDKLIADLEAGRVVVCDRFVSSNIAFQGSKIADAARRKKLQELLLWLEYDLLKLPRPNIEIALIADEQYFLEGAHLARGAADPQRQYAGGTADVHEESRPLQVAVNQYYASLQEGPRLKPIRIIDARRRRLTPQEVHEQVWAAVSAAAPR